MLAWQGQQSPGAQAGSSDVRIDSRIRVGPSAGPNTTNAGFVGSLAACSHSEIAMSLYKRIVMTIRIKPTAELNAMNTESIATSKTRLWLTEGTSYESRTVLRGRGGGGGGARRGRAGGRAGGGGGARQR